MTPTTHPELPVGGVVAKYAMRYHEIMNGKRELNLTLGNSAFGSAKDRQVTDKLPAIQESVDYSDYGYWVKPNGAALVVPDSSHYKVLLRHYQGENSIGQDRYGGALADGWCWVAVTGNFLCFVDSAAVTRPAALTLIAIINQYSDYDDFRFVLVEPGTHTGSQKHDFTDARSARAFARDLIAESTS